MEINKLIGQKFLTTQLKKIINDGRVGHAYAFSGSQGIGKRTFALAFAKDLLCIGTKGETCRCLSCRTFEEGTNPDFFEVKTEKQSIGVESIRDMQADAANRPTYGSRKVYFIDNAERMTPQAQNCLLKTLEEPPEYVVILLSTKSFEAMLPTIQSRTVNLRLNLYSDDEMKKILTSLCTISEDKMEFILKFSGGIPGDAMHMIEEGTVRDLRRQIFSLLEKPDEFSSQETIRKALIDNRGELTTVLNILLSIYRDCLMVLEGLENRLINSDKKDMIRNVAETFSKRKLMDKVASLERLRQNFKYNINYPLGIDVLMMEIQEA